MKLMPFTLRFWLWSKCQQMMSFSSVYGFSAILSSMMRSEEHTSELQSRLHLVCRLLLEKKIRQPRVCGRSDNGDHVGRAHRPRRGGLSPPSAWVCLCYHTRSNFTLLRRPSVCFAQLCGW